MSRNGRDGVHVHPIRHHLHERCLSRCDLNKQFGTPQHKQDCWCDDVKRLLTQNVQHG